MGPSGRSCTHNPCRRESRGVVARVDARVSVTPGRAPNLLFSQGGYFTLLSDGDDAPRYEYLMAEFGTSVPTARDGGAAAPPKLIAASPPELCSPLAEDFVDSARGAALLVVRGTCDFFTKAKHANAAGAAMVIIVNTRGDPLSRMGVQPRWKSLNITAPVVMVSSAAGDALRAALEAAGGSGAAVARFTASPTVRAATWRVLGELEAGIGWPADAKARAELIAQWEPDTADWPERRAALARGLAVVNPGGAAHTEL